MENPVETDLRTNQAASFFLLAVLSGILLSVSCLCGECIALKLAPPPPQRQQLNSSEAAMKSVPEESDKFAPLRQSGLVQLYWSSQCNSPSICSPGALRQFSNAAVTPTW